MGNYFLFIVDYMFQGILGGVYIGDEGFDGYVWSVFFDLYYCLVLDFSILVFVFVVVDGSNYGVFNVYQIDGFGYVVRFVFVVFWWMFCFYGVKIIGMGIGIVQDYKGSGAGFLVFVYVWVVIVLVDGVQVVFVY